MVMIPNDYWFTPSENCICENKPCIWEGSSLDCIFLEVCLSNVILEIASISH